MTVYFYETKIGPLGVAEENGTITHIYFATEPLPRGLEVSETPVLKEAGRQLRDYFAGTLKEFDLPLAPQGTPFMLQVWHELVKIPYGATASYKDIAERIGNPKAMRAVGMANNRNPIPIVIPCHRVIGANGKMIGYGGGIDIKIQLLELESKA